MRVVCVEEKFWKIIPIEKLERYRGREIKVWVPIAKEFEGMSVPFAKIEFAEGRRPKYISSRIRKYLKEKYNITLCTVNREFHMLNDGLSSKITVE